MPKVVDELHPVRASTKNIACCFWEQHCEDCFFSPASTKAPKIMPICSFQTGVGCMTGKIWENHTSQWRINMASVSQWMPHGLRLSFPRFARHSMRRSSFWRVRQVRRMRWLYISLCHHGILTLNSRRMEKAKRETEWSARECFSKSWSSNSL